MKKRVIGLFVVSLLLLSVSLSFVSAQTFEQTLNDILEGVEGIIRFLVGDVTDISGTTSGEVFFIKLLVFLIIFALVFMAVRQFPPFEDRGALSAIISLAVSFIAVRYITTESLINFIWLPYGVLGILLTAFLPFIIVFFFLVSLESEALQKIGWVALVVIFAMLGALRWNDFAVGGRSISIFGIELFRTGGAWWQNLALVYIIIAIISGIMVFWGYKVRNYLEDRKAQFDRAKPHHKKVIQLKSELEKLNDELSHAPAADRGELRKQIRDKIKDIKIARFDARHA